MKRLARSPTLRLFSISVADQVLLSAGNFLIGFLLIRETSDFDYGLFVLVQSAITLLVSAQNAWLSGPLMVTAPHKSVDERLLMIGSIERSQRRVLTWVAALALVVPAVCFSANIWTATFALAMVAAVFAGYTAMLRDFCRSVLLIFSRPYALFSADVVYVSIILGVAAFAIFGPWPAAPVAVAGLAAGAAVGGFVAYASTARDTGWRGEASQAGAFWRELRPLGIWSSAGAVIYWIYSQSYNYLLAGSVGLSAVADVNATRLLLMPAFILTVGVKSLLTPLAANWLAKDGVAPMMRRLKLFIPIIALVNLSYIGVVWFARDLLTTGLMHKTIQDLERLIVLWSTIVMVCMMRDVLQSAAFVLGRLRSLAWLGAVSAAIAIPIMVFGISRYGPAAALFGQICGELVGLVGVIWLLRGAVAEYKKKEVASD